MRLKKVLKALEDDHRKVWLEIWDQSDIEIVEMIKLNRVYDLIFSNLIKLTMEEIRD